MIITTNLHNIFVHKFALCSQGSQKHLFGVFVSYFLLQGFARLCEILLPLQPCEWCSDAKFDFFSEITP